MIAVSLQRLIKETSPLDFSFLFIEQSVLEGTVGKNNLFLTYWVSIYLYTNT